jgi:hypothetical protein
MTGFPKLSLISRVCVLGRSRSLHIRSRSTTIAGCMAGELSYSTISTRLLFSLATAVEQTYIGLHLKDQAIASPGNISEHPRLCLTRVASQRTGCFNRRTHPLTSVDDSKNHFEAIQAAGLVRPSTRMRATFNTPCSRDLNRDA